MMRSFMLYVEMTRNRTDCMLVDFYCFGKYKICSFCRE